MSSAEIEAEMRSDTTWQRPTWPLGSWRLHEQRMRQQAHAEQEAPFGRQGGGATAGGHADGTDAGVPLHPEDRALRELQLDRSASFVEIKARYRELAKTHHPDANGGDKQAEERLKKINQAYTILKASHGR
jgi:DnaJ-domain-containing protein 1